MILTRGKRAKWNIIVTLISRIVTIFCGLIVPRLMVRTFGSEAYGATSSIVQFLAYITLLEGGIGSVARAALYKPLAEEDNKMISVVTVELQHFFRIVAWIFIGYTLILACSFGKISNIQVLDWFSTFLLVMIISISTFAQYYIGITNVVLLEAAQRSYITSATAIFGTLLNTVLVVLLVNSGCGLLTVKLASSCVYILRPLALHFYVKRNFNLCKPTERNKSVLSQKWTGLGQHIAYFLHSNTDIMVLTVFANLSLVAVYSVYNLVVANIQNLTTSFASGMEALFGDMIAKEETDNLREAFDRYETLISVVALILFATTMVMIMPFIQLYTDGITDVDYWAPVFAMLLILSALLYCMRLPYHSVAIAAGHFQQIKWAAYGESIINIVLSISLVRRFGLTGVAMATVIATVFRFAYYVIYLSNHILYRGIMMFVKRIFINALCFLVSYFLGSLVIKQLTVNTYLAFAGGGVLTTGITAVVTLCIYGIFWRKDVTRLLTMLFKNRGRGAAA